MKGPSVMIFGAQLPPEVQESFQGFAPSDQPVRVHWFRKVEVSRCAAWEYCRALNQLPTTRNPFRKAHTKNFWVWVELDS